MSRPAHLTARTATFATALLCLLAFTGSAAAGSPGVVRHSTDGQFLVNGTKHYKISLQTEGNRVVIVARNAPLTAFYLAKGHNREDGVEAGLGKLGHVSLHFENPSGHSRTLRDNLQHCGGERVVRETGVFKGSFVFRGEQDYTDVSAHRIKGFLFHTSERVCGPHRQARAARAFPAWPGATPRRLGQAVRGGAGASLKFDSKGVSAVAHTGGGREVLFEATKFGPVQEEWVIGANQFERRGGLEIDREALLPFAATNSITFGDGGEHPATASVTPPKPFLGTATYTADPAPGTLSWDGSLSVPLPGAGTVQLTGKDFKAIACHTLSLDKFSHCIDNGLGFR